MEAEVSGQIRNPQGPAEVTPDSSYDIFTVTPTRAYDFVVKELYVTDHQPTKEGRYLCNHKHVCYNPD